MVANKVFGFSPEYTLWGVSFQMLNAMFSEQNYMQTKDDDDYIEINTIDGPKRVKKSKDNKI